MSILHGSESTPHFSMMIKESKPWLQGAIDFQKFPLRWWLRNLWSTGGASTLRARGNLGDAEDFDKFCKNVMEKPFETHSTFYLTFPFYVS